MVEIDKVRCIEVWLYGVGLQIDAHDFSLMDNLAKQSFFTWQSFPSYTEENYKNAKKNIRRLIVIPSVDEIPKV